MLDTHALLWWFNRPEALGRAATEAMRDPEATVLVSPVSAYEIAYKHRIGKLGQAETLLGGLAERLAGERFATLPLTLDHGRAGGDLEWSHRDPFDRLLVAQALADDPTLVSNEHLFDATGVRRLW